MNETRQNLQTEVIGMDAHSRKIVLCHMRRENGRSVKVKCVATTLDALEGTYAKHFPTDVPTFLEASTNSFLIAKRLAAIGRKAVVLCSDVLSGLSRKDRINDRIDAEKLARVALGGDDETIRTVFVPSVRGTELREEYFAYRDARKDATRAANRIWNFCSRHGLDVDRRISKKRCTTLLPEGRALGWSPMIQERAKGLVNAWSTAEALCREREKAIEKEVFASPEMTRLQQVPGIRFIGAFALVAFTENVRRFASGKKLVSYIGLNPSVCGSGEKESRRRTSRYGRSDLKSIFVEAAQTVLRTGTPLSRWAKHLLAKGKPWNVAVCALARKLAVLCWHVLMGHPAPTRERESATAKKLALLAGRVGKGEVRAAGYGSSAEYVVAMVAALYGHLPERPAAELLGKDVARPGKTKRESAIA